MLSKTLMSAVLAGVFAASAALAQSGYDTGAGKPSGITTNSGTARPDANVDDAGARTETPSGVARPTTSSSGASGQRGKRPDTETTGSVGAPKATTNSGRAAPTQSDD